METDLALPDGRTLHVYDTGDGTPVCWHHGTPQIGAVPAPLLALPGIRWLSYDRPGYGGSTRHEGRTAADCGADIEVVCDELGLERICVWGISGGGPHALAAAALLPERVAAAASLASVAPYGAEDLDWLAGMGELNVEEFGVIFKGEEAHRASMEEQRQGLLAARPEELVEQWQTLLGPADREVATGEFAAELLAHMRAGIETGGDGWLDDDLAFVMPWGFDVATIRTPILLWQGEQDKFVPFGHGLWLAERIPGVEARLTAEDGHLTLGQRRIPEVHAWLLEHF